MDEPQDVAGFGAGKSRREIDGKQAVIAAGDGDAAKRLWEMSEELVAKAV